jgi:hypothetical protein
MTKLTKSELFEFAQVFILANTPLSLFNGLIRCAGMQKLRKNSEDVLLRYYDHITGRAERNEIVLALAYAVLCALVLRTREIGSLEVDASRLQWGQRIWDFMKRSDSGTGGLGISARQAPTITASNSPSGETRFILGPDGLPALSWRNVS